MADFHLRDQRGEPRPRGGAGHLLRSRRSSFSCFTFAWGVRLAELPNCLRKNKAYTHSDRIATISIMDEMILHAKAKMCPTRDSALIKREAWSSTKAFVRANSRLIPQNRHGECGGHSRVHVLPHIQPAPTTVDLRTPRDSHLSSSIAKDTGLNGSGRDDRPAPL